MKRLIAILISVCVPIFAALAWAQYLQHDDFGAYEQIKRGSQPTYQSTVAAESTLLYYWPMQEGAGSTTLAAAKGSTAINLTSATCGVTGQIGTAVSFTGSASSAGVTAATLNLSSYNKIVVEALVYFPSFNSSDGLAWEFSENTGSNTDGFMFDPNSSSGNMLVQIKGDVGFNYAGYWRPSTATWHHVVIVFDKSQATNEEFIYIDGIQALISTVGGTNNNTNNFGNNLLHIASRGGSSLWCNEKIQHLAIYSDLSLAKIQTHAALAGLGPITHAVQLADLSDNGYDNVNAPKQSALSRLYFTTSADRVVLTGDTTIYNTASSYAQLIVKVNGAVYSYFQFSGNGSSSLTIELGNAGTSRTVEIIGGPQAIVSNTVLGTFIDSIVYSANSSITIPTPSIGTRIVVYGDSISVGQASAYPGTQGWTALERITYSRSIMLEAWGNRSLYNDANTGSLITAFVSRIATYSPSKIVIAIGTNDYGLQKWSSASFGTAYAALVDALHSAMPSLTIIMQTPIVRTSEVDLGYGTLGDYRTQINTIHSTRGWTTLIDGTTLVSTGDLSDGVHPTAAGHTTYATNIDSLIP